MRPVMKRGGLAALVLLCAGAAPAPPPAHAAAPSGSAPSAPTPGPTRAAWSTYLRAGPGQGFSAIDEVEHDAALTVLDCAGGWCRVSDGRAQGYVDRDALALPTIATPNPPSSTGCVKTALADDRDAMRTRFCTGG